MRFTPALLDDIRARLPVSAVVGKHVKLVKAGREWKGLSPFKAERTPSFYVNDQKGFYHCFASGEHGDIFTFLTKVEGLPFPEAVERLAGQAGVELPKFSPEAAQREESRKGLHEAMELATLWFEQQLRGAGGQEARRYLASRELGPDVQARFRLGFAPGARHGLRDHLAGKGVPVEVMIEAGLLVAGDDIPVPYDRFRERVIFPICDIKGRVIAFGGRAMKPDQQPKYLNSPDTPLFHKGRVLYNHHLARKAAHDAGTVIAVEGYVDAIALVRAGLAHVVAPLGTALTGEQVDLLWRMGPEPILCFDGDKAGQRAAHRAIDVVLPKLGAGRTLRFAFLPEGQDPDDLLRTSGPAALQEVLTRPIGLFDVIWSREVERQPLDTPERRADLERRLRELAMSIADETLRKYYRSAFEERLKLTFGDARGGSPRQGYAPRRRPLDGRGPRPVGERAKTRVALNDLGSTLKQSRLFSSASRAALPREAALVVTVINHPELLDMHAETFAALALGSAELRRLREAALAAAALDAEQATLRDTITGMMGVDALTTAEALINHGDFWAGAEAALPDALQGWADAVDLHERASTLHTEMRMAAAELVDSGSDESLARLQAIARRLHAGGSADNEWDAFGRASGRGD